jgi:hypothetical protein
MVECTVALCPRPAEFFIDALWHTDDAEVCLEHLSAAVSVALRTRAEMKVSWLQRPAELHSPRPGALADRRLTTAGHAQPR